MSALSLALLTRMACLVINVKQVWILLVLSVQRWSWIRWVKRSIGNVDRFDAREAADVTIEKKPCARSKPKP